MQRQYPYHPQQMQQQQHQMQQRQQEQQLYAQQQVAHGQGYPHMPNMQQQPTQQQVNRQILIEDAIGVAREQVPGQVVQAELERKGGRLIYEVDIVTAEGVKYEVEIDANTGEVLGVELD